MLREMHALYLQPITYKSSINSLLTADEVQAFIEPATIGNNELAR